MELKQEEEEVEEDHSEAQGRAESGDPGTALESKSVDKFAMLDRIVRKSFKERHPRHVASRDKPETAQAMVEPKSEDSSLDDLRVPLSRAAAVGARLASSSRRVGLLTAIDPRAGLDTLSDTVRSNRRAYAVAHKYVLYEVSPKTSSSSSAKLRAAYPPHARPAGASKGKLTGELALPALPFAAGGGAELDVLRMASLLLGETGERRLEQVLVLDATLLLSNLNVSLDFLAAQTADAVLGGGAAAELLFLRNTAAVRRALAAALQWCDVEHAGARPGARACVADALVRSDGLSAARPGPLSEACASPAVRGRFLARAPPSAESADPAAFARTAVDLRGFCASPLFPAPLPASLRSLASVALPDPSACERNAAAAAVAQKRAKDKEALLAKRRFDAAIAGTQNVDGAQEANIAKKEDIAAKEEDIAVKKQDIVAEQNTAAKTSSEDLKTAQRLVALQKSRKEAWDMPLQCDDAMDVLERNVRANVDLLPLAPSSVAVTTIFGGPRVAPLRVPVSRNRQQYAGAHGYRYVEVVSVEPGARPEVSVPGLSLPVGWDARNYMWGKLPLLSAIFEQMPEVQHVLWVDADIVLTNTAVSVDFLVAQDRDWVISGDQNGANTGTFLVRRSAWTLALLKRAYAVYPGPYKWWPGEQGSITICLFDERAELAADLERRRFFVQHMQARARHTTQREADAHWQRLTRPAKQHVQFTPKCVLNSDMLSWVRGNFNAHFAGQKPERKVELTREFEAHHTVRDESLTRFLDLTTSNGQRVRVPLPVQAHSP